MQAIIPQTAERINKNKHIVWDGILATPELLCSCTKPTGNTGIAPRLVRLTVDDGRITLALECRKCGRNYMVTL